MTVRDDRVAPVRGACPRRVLAVAAILLAAWAVVAQERRSDPPADFTVARLQYGGGGDWYANPSSLPNLLTFIRQNTNIGVADRPVRVRVADNDLFGFPYLYMTGHGNVRFTDEEVVRLRAYLTSGGFLHADDNYGMDESFRREIRRIFPNNDLVPLPHDHEVFHSWFEMPGGLPKVHEHDGKAPVGYGIHHMGRLVVFYSYESDLGDGWEDAHIHNDPEPVRRAALRMGTNIAVYALSH